MKIRRLIYRTPLYILFICFFLSAKIHFFSHSLSVNHKKKLHTINKPHTQLRQVWGLFNTVLYQSTTDNF